MEPPIQPRENPVIRKSPEIERRETFANLLNWRGLKNFAVEVGTERAGFAVKFLQRWGGHKLWCIDPWETDLPDYDEPDLQFDRSPDYDLAVAALAPYAQRVTIKRTTSDQAAAKLPDSLFDFVYIDANHAFDAVRRDLVAWWPKLHARGILAGHDWDVDNMPGVVRAVREFAAARSLNVYTTREPHYQSWYIYRTHPARLFESVEQTLRLESQAARIKHYSRRRKFRQ